MKLTIEKHPELAKLAGYFQKIEAIAEKMGIEVDDLVTEYRGKNRSMYTLFKKNVLSIAQKRSETLLNRQGRGGSPEEASIVDLTIIVNDKIN